MLSKRRKKHSTSVLELCCMKFNSDTVASSDYIINYGGYYSIVDKENIISLLDDIKQKSIWMCRQYFV